MGSDCLHKRTSTPLRSSRRRRLLLAGTALCAAPLLGRTAGAEPKQENRPSLGPAGQGTAIRLAQTTDLGGPLADLGQALHHGAQACFREVNARGGVHGRQILLEAKDDGYDVKRSVENLRGFVSDPGVFALFNCFGTPTAEAALPMIRGSDMPYFAPLTGASLARPRDMRNVLHVRAGYSDEVDRIVQHVVAVGSKRIGVVHQNNAFGKDVLAAATAALKARNVHLAASPSMDNTGSNWAEAVQAIHAANVDAVLVGLAGQPTARFVTGMRGVRRALPLYALSVMGAATTLQQIGDAGAEITVSQVVPAPNRVILPLAQEYMAAWTAAKVPLPPSHAGMEGYINARVFAEILQRAGKNPTRAAFLDSAWSVKGLNLSGFELSFASPGDSASRFVELTMLTRGGRFIA